MGEYQEEIKKVRKQSKTDEYYKRIIEKMLKIEKKFDDYRSSLDCFDRQFIHELKFHLKNTNGKEKFLIQNEKRAFLYAKKQERDHFSQPYKKSKQKNLLEI